MRAGRTARTAGPRAATAAPYGYQDANCGYNGRYIDQPQYNYYFREDSSAGTTTASTAATSTAGARRPAESAGLGDGYDRQLPVDPVGAASGDSASAAEAPRRGGDQGQQGKCTLLCERKDD